MQPLQILESRHLFDPGLDASTVYVNLLLYRPQSFLNLFISRKIKTRNKGIRIKLNKYSPVDISTVFDDKKFTSVADNNKREIAINDCLPPFI